MGKIITFDHVTADGFFAGPNGEIDWFKRGNGPDEEENRQFTLEAMRTSGMLVFGHTTYDMMAGYWPTPFAAQNELPAFIEFMNNVPKTVFSRKLKSGGDSSLWKNVSVMSEIDPVTVAGWKKRDDRVIAILGSGSVVRQFAALGLIDEYQFMVNPVILGTGRRLMENVARFDLELLSTRTFGKGNVLLIYRPVR